MPLSRTVKFEVYFSSLRDEQRDVLYGRLWGVSNDLTRAANRLASAIWLLLNNQVPRPLKKTGEERPLQSCYYAGMSGDWQPFGESMYFPYKPKDGLTHPRASSSALLGVARLVQTRMNTDLKDIRRGKKSLATFNALPILFTDGGVRFGADGCIVLNVFGKDEEGGTTIRVRPRNLDSSKSAILDRIRSGMANKVQIEQARRMRKTGVAGKGGGKAVPIVVAEGGYTCGGGSLGYDDRKKKWFLALNWTDQHFNVLLERTSGLIAGIDLGVKHAIWISYRDKSGKPMKFSDVINFPRSTLRAVARVESEKRERGNWNRKEFGRPGGRGTRRYARNVRGVGEKVANIHDTMMDQIVAAAIGKMKKRGADVFGLENLWWSMEKNEVTAANSDTKRQAAAVRARNRKFHQGAMRAKLKCAGQKGGMLAIDVNASMSSRECHGCGKIWKEPKGGFGRLDRDRFRCSCGVGDERGMPADKNAALNIAKRALDIFLATETTADAAK